MLDRRHFIQMALGGALAMCTAPLFAETLPDFWAAPRSLWLRRYVNHHWEEQRAVYYADGRLIVDGYSQICNILRDATAGVVVRMNPDVLDILYAMQGWFSINGQDRPIVVHSGFRTVLTNEAVGGKAASQHLIGNAVDLHMPGVPVDYLHKLALRVRGGGVGFYPQDEFVHVDTGRPRTWVGFAKRHKTHT